MQETFMKQMYNHSHRLSFTSFSSKRSFYIPIIFFKIFLINKTTDKFILSQFVKKKKDCAQSRSCQHKLQHCCFYLGCLLPFKTKQSLFFY